MTIFFSILLGVALISVIVLQHPVFGRAPRGERLARIERSPHYRNGRFHNLHNAPTMAGSKSFVQRLKDFLFDRPDRITPGKPLPFVHNSLDSLAQSGDDALVWLGHS